MARFVELPSVPPNAAHTCLFTEAALPADTKLEHTILRALGGRVRSRIVSSSDFNNSCGSTIDPFLVLTYGDIVRVLGPLLAGEHLSGNLKVEIPGEDARFTFVLDERGGLTIRGARIERDPQTHQVTRIYAPPDAGPDLIARHAQGRPYTTTTVPTTTADNFFVNRPLILPPLEVCALKCGMLTFDHLLARHPARRFTRLQQLDSVRKLVREFVLAGRVDPAPIGYHSLGMQYAKAIRLRSIRGQIPVSPRPFEHVLIASGSRRRRRIDMVWSVFGFDPFGFRLTKVYNGDDFTCVVINRPLRGDGGVSGPFWKDEAEQICDQTNACSYPVRMTDAIKCEVVRQITTHRQDAHRRAVDLVERSDAQLLVERLRNEAALNRTGNRSIEAAFRFRLDRLFMGRIHTDADLKRFSAIVDCHLARFDAAERGTDIADSAAPTPVDWPRWIAAYHRILDAMRPEFGLPGHAFTNGTTIETVPATVKQLSDIPLQL